MPRNATPRCSSRPAATGRRFRPSPWAAGLAILLLLGQAQGKGGAAALAAADSAVPGEILLKLTRADLLPPLLVKHGLTLDGSLGSRPVFRVKVIGNADVADAVAALSAEPGVLIAEPNQLHAGPEAAKNNVWAIGTAQAYRSQWAPAAVRLPEAWQLSTGAGVRVAVLDTGVDPNHPLLAGRLLPGRDFVDRDGDPSEVGSRQDVAYGHGTHVAGLVALAAPEAWIMPLRVLNPQGGGDAWALAEAMLHAVDPDRNPATDDGVQVINLSLAGPNRTRLLDTVALLASCGTPDPAVPADDLSDASYDQDRARCSGFGGAIVVAAAGNDGSRKVRAYPAAEGAYGLVAVAASGSDGRLANFSNSGSWIQMAAPGVGVTSSVPGGWGTWSGTSMAAPLVAGTAALLRSAAPWLDATGVARCLVRTARDLNDRTMGQLDAQAALRAVGDRGLCR
jgi:subtilisin family serine protease